MLATFRNEDGTDTNLSQLLWLIQILQACCELEASGWRLPPESPVFTINRAQKWSLFDHLVGFTSSIGRKTQSGFSKIESSKNGGLYSSRNWETWDASRTNRILSARCEGFPKRIRIPNLARIIWRIKKPGCSLLACLYNYLAHCLVFFVPNQTKPNQKRTDKKT